MALTKPITLNIGTIDIGTGGTTSALRICFDYNWSISTVVTGTPGNAKYTLEVSHDAVEWKEYKSGSTLVNIEDAIQDEYLAWNYIRLVVQSGGGSAGTVDFTIILKSN